MDSEKLSILKRETSEIKKIQTWLSDAEKKADELTSEVRYLRGKSEKETKELENFENGNFRSFISSIIGNRDSVLEREKHEAYTAQNELFLAESSLRSLTAEISEKKDKLADLEVKKKEYSELISQKLSIIGDQNDMINIINSEKMEILGDISRWEAAVDAGEKVMKIMKVIILELADAYDRAETLALFKMNDNRDTYRRWRNEHVDNANMYYEKMKADYAIFCGNAKNNITIPDIPEYIWAEADIEELVRNDVWDPCSLDEYFFGNTKRFYSDTLNFEKEFGKCVNHAKEILSQKKTDYEDACDRYEYAIINANV